MTWGGNAIRYYDSLNERAYKTAVDLAARVWSMRCIEGSALRPSTPATVRQLQLLVLCGDEVKALCRQRAGRLIAALATGMPLRISALCVQGHLGLASCARVGGHFGTCSTFSTVTSSSGVCACVDSQTRAASSCKQIEYVRRSIACARVLWVDGVVPIG